ncbi:hypothetical protein OCU04_007877 [Sclerotinia nivalis]|uniref:Uncharacterized protein n=1 Tax=Sclerotinia nivalis TaxID=352851 RepID=A0A9X0DHT1_9HELO|nr:hypothetical protein OCU04_007877 [Sclerotinia nivalis]
MSNLQLAEALKLRERAIQEIPHLKKLLKDYEEFVDIKDYASVDASCNAVTSEDKDTTTASSDSTNGDRLSPPISLNSLSPSTIPNKDAYEVDTYEPEVYDGFEDEEPCDPSYALDSTSQFHNDPLVVQAFRTTKNNPNTYYTVVSEERIFTFMPLLQTLFGAKASSNLKGDEDNACYDPKISKEVKQKTPGKIICP